MTTRLYYQDSHLQTFSATVISCEWNEKKTCYATVLDQTAFFPEGGGQYADPGTINGIPVIDVREQGDKVLHYTKQPLEAGTIISGQIDYEERFSRMQQHSGEHIVSGLVHRHFGYDNVGFHLGQELVTMDFDGSLTEEQLRMVELEANQAVAANIPVQTAFPSADELKALNYRSKKELEGQVRIVTIPGYDICACCAPHVKHTGEIGIIRLTDAVKYKGGTRVTILCGFRALKDTLEKERNIREISRLLSAKPYETAEAVRHLQSEAAQLKEQLLQAQTRYLDQKLETMSAELDADGNYLLFEEGLDKNAVRRFADAGKAHCTGLCGVFLKTDTGYQYTFTSTSVDLKTFLTALHQRLEGKGGGKGEMVQGTISGEIDNLTEAALREAVSAAMQVVLTAS